VKQHSKKTKGSFWDKLINKGRDFFEDDETKL
jgi:hypothetical protein